MQIEAPKNLGKTGRAFWKKVMSEYVLTEAHDLERLRQACKCLDDIAQAEERVKKDGPFHTDRYGGLKEHPGARVIRENRALFLRFIRELRLDLTTGPESRPPSNY